MSDDDIEEIRNRKLSDVLRETDDINEKSEPLDRGDDNRSNLGEGTTIDETVSIDEAVGYGFNMLKGIAKYIIFIIILNGIGFFLVAVSVEENSGAFLIGIPLIIAGIILNVALSIGVLYKLWVDILARSRK